MRGTVDRWIRDNRSLFYNSSTLIGTTAVTSGLGFVYWWLAAHLFAPDAVGLASASVSAMLLLGSVGTLGFGALLMGELARSTSDAGGLIVTALAVVGVFCGVLGVCGGLVAPHLSPELTPLAESVPALALFAVGISLAGMALVLDQACVGLLRGGLQFWRNSVFSVVKLAALTIVGALGARGSGLDIYGTWALGTGLSLVVVAYALRGRIRAPLKVRIEWRLLTRLRSATLAHYGLDLALQAPGLLLPMVVTVSISAMASASFYAAWMIAGLLFVVPGALTAVLYRIGREDPAKVSDQARVTARLSLGTGAIGILLGTIGSEPLLRLFGVAYAEQGAWALRLLLWAVFPVIAKTHYVAISRIRGTMAEAAGLVGLGGLLELLLAIAGAAIGGLTGLSAGWVVATYVEGTLFLILARRAMKTSGSFEASSTAGESEIRPAIREAASSGAVASE